MVDFNKFIVDSIIKCLYLLKAELLLLFKILDFSLVDVARVFRLRFAFINSCSTELNKFLKVKLIVNVMVWLLMFSIFVL